MNVLSLFDGISCGQVALTRIGIKVDKYYAAEIDKYAIKVAQANYPDTVQMGGITKWRDWDIDWSSINLLTAGFPCQAWSVAGKQKGDNDPRGALVHDLIDIWNHIKQHNPDMKFLFENVKMKKEFLDYINNLFGVDPMLINSALVSAQNRKRYYWTNIEGVEQPQDRGLLLKDIVHEYYDGECNVMRDKSCTVRVGGRNSPPFSKQEWDGVYSKNKLIDNFNVNPSGKGMNGVVRDVRNDKSTTITTNKGEGSKISIPLAEYIVPFDKTLQILDKEVEKGKVGFFRKNSQANRVYYIHGKSVTLMGVAGGGAAKMGQYLFGRITPDRIEKRQNGQRFNDGRKFYTLTAQDNHGALVEGYIRKLTPVECCRLQTLPDDYFSESGISNSQQYKCIGNGWTVDVVAHIFKGLK